MKTEILEIITQHKYDHISSEQAVSELLNISDIIISFSDMIGFTKWVLQSDDFDNITRYIYIETKDDFIDDDGNRYTWEELYEIYQKN